MKIVLNIILFCLNLLNVVIHTIGTYALVSLYGTSRHKPQRLYIINLSICEGILNFCQWVRNMPEFVSISSHTKLTVDVVNRYILIITFTGISFVYYLDMIILTLDRLAIVILGLNYTLYWCESKAKRLLAGTWVIGIVISIAVTLGYGLKEFDWETVFFKYFYPTLDFAFLIIAVLTYSLIFHKRNDSVRKMSNISGLGVEVHNENKCSEKSLYIVPLLLIIIFLVFMVIPDLTCIFIGTINSKLSETLNIICWILYAVSNIADAGIYIYFIPDIRKYLLIKFRIIKCEVIPEPSLSLPISNRSSTSKLSVVHLQPGSSCQHIPFDSKGRSTNVRSSDGL